MFTFPLTQKKLPAGGIPAILRGAFSNDSAKCLFTAAACCQAGQAQQAQRSCRRLGD